MAVTCSDTIIEVVMDHSKEIPVLSGHHRSGDRVSRDRGTHEGCFCVIGNTLLEENAGQKSVYFDEFPSCITAWHN